MKIGIIADIHSNLPALEATLALFATEGCDEIICCGDIIGIGPYPEETVQKIMSLENAAAVYGNHEGYLMCGMDSSVSSVMGNEEVQFHKWEHSRLSDVSRRFIESLPPALAIVRDGVRISAMHYRMEPDGRYSPILWRAGVDDWDYLFCGIGADVLIHGHDHRPALRHKDGRLYINPGSLGCPHSIEGFARAGILEILDGKPEYRRVEARYDVGAVLSRMDELECPARLIIKRIFFGTS